MGKRNRDNEWSQPKRIEDIRRLGRKIGLLNLSKTELSKKYDVTRKTVINDFKKIYTNGLDKNVVAQSKLHIDDLNGALLTELQSDFIKCKNLKDRAAIANTLINLSVKMTDFLERFGFKEKIADKIQQTNQIDISCADFSECADELRETPEK